MSWATLNKLAGFLVSQEATSELKAIPIATVVAANICSKPHTYRLLRERAGFTVLLDSEGRQVVWYDHVGLRDMCRFGEFYPRSIPRSSIPVAHGNSAPAPTVIEAECKHPIVKLPGSHILDGAKKGEPILVEWVRPAYHKDTMAAGVKRPETFDESLKEDLDDLLSYLKANVPDKATTTSARLLNKIAGIYGVLRGDELE